MARTGTSKQSQSSIPYAVSDELPGGSGPPKSRSPTPPKTLYTGDIEDQAYAAAVIAGYTLQKNSISVERALNDAQVKASKTELDLGYQSAHDAWWETCKNSWFTIAGNIVQAAGTGAVALAPLVWPLFKRMLGKTEDSPQEISLADELKPGAIRDGLSPTSKDASTAAPGIAPSEAKETETVEKHGPKGIGKVSDNPKVHKTAEDEKKLEKERKRMEEMLRNKQKEIDDNKDLLWFSSGGTAINYLSYALGQTMSSAGQLSALPDTYDKQISDAKASYMKEMVGLLGQNGGDVGSVVGASSQGLTSVVGQADQKNSAVSQDLGD